MKFKSRIKIGNKLIGGKNDPCFIIAEAGSNHNRDFETAKKLIDEAKNAGADAIKFQTYSAGTLYPKNKKPLFLIGEKEKPFDIIKKIELPRDWQAKLARYAENKGIIFLSTPFDKEAIDELDKLVPAFKWASPELIDKPLLEYAAKKGKPIILSTGFYGTKEIRESLGWVEGTGNSAVALLHCTGLYPTKPEDVNLRAIAELKKFKIPVGFSDHTASVVIPAVAVAIGAKIIEKHFTLDRNMNGPDHAFALEPIELSGMVKNIRDVEKSMGSGVKKPTIEESKKEKLIRRGIVAKRQIKKGEKFSLDNITTKRVGSGSLPPKDIYKIFNKKAKRNILQDQIIKEND